MTLLLAAFLTLIPIQAHTADELDVWVDDWDQRAGIYPTDRMLAELRDMISRHTGPTPVEKSPQIESSAISANPVTVSGDWEPLVAAYFPAAEVGTALQIINCESNGNPSAKNPRSSATGLFQILASLWAPHFGVSVEALYDPETNTRLAYEIWKDYGWGAWSCYGR